MSVIAWQHGINVCDFLLGNVFGLFVCLPGNVLMSMEYFNSYNCFLFNMLSMTDDLEMC